MCHWWQLKIKSIYFQNDIFENLSPKFSKLIGVWTGKLSLEVPTLGLESKTWKLNKKWKLKPNEERVRRTKTKRAQTKQTLSSPDLWSKSKDNKEKRRGSHLLIYDNFFSKNQKQGLAPPDLRPRLLRSASPARLAGQPETEFKCNSLYAIFCWTFLCC